MKKVIAYVHTHWDREWYREFEEFRLRLIEVVDKVIENLDNKSLPVFYFDAQTAALEDYLEIFPEKEEKIKQYIKDKKIYTGPFYCSTDLFLTNAECMIRNLCLGITKSREWGCNDFAGYLADTFGHSPSAACILKAFGIQNAVLWRGLGNLPAEINWEGLNVTYLIQGYFQDFLSLNIPIEKKAEFIKKYLDKISARSEEYVLLPIGADHLCPPDNLNEQIKALNSCLSDYKIEIGSPFDYFNLVKNQKRQKVYGEFLDNSLNFILPGVYSSRLYLKRENIKLQWDLTRITEPVQAVASYCYGKKNNQKQVDYAYKNLIKNHAHDSIYGCGIDKVHDDMMIRFEDIKSVSNGIKKRVIRDLSCENGTLTVMNLSNFNYSGNIAVRTPLKLPRNYNAYLANITKCFTDEKLYNVNQIPVTEDYCKMYEYVIDVKDLKPFSVTKLTQKNINKENYLKTTSCSIENNYIALEIKNNKISVKNKKNNKVYHDFISIIDRADIGDSYNFGPLKGDKVIKADLISFKTKQVEGKYSSLTMTYKIKIPVSSDSKGRKKKLLTHRIILNAILSNQDDFIEFTADWENKSKNHILQIAFNLEKYIKTTFSEDAVGIIKREFDPDYDIYKDIPAPRGIELKPNTAPMQRFVWTEGTGIVTKGLTEYEVLKNTLNITILRASGVISNPCNSSRGTPAGPPLPVPGLQGLGKNTAEFALCFKEESQMLYETIEQYFGSCITLFTNLEDKTFFSLNNKNILIQAVKLQNNNLILRVHNTSDKKQSAEFISKIEHNEIYECTPLEENIKKITSYLEFEPKEIKTIKLS